MAHSKKKSNKTKKGATSKRTRPTTAASSPKGSKKPRFLPPSPYGPFWNGTTNNAKTIVVLENERDHAFHYDAYGGKMTRLFWKKFSVEISLAALLAPLLGTKAGKSSVKGYEYCIINNPQNYGLDKYYYYCTTVLDMSDPYLRRII